MKLHGEDKLYWPPEIVKTLLIREHGLYSAPMCTLSLINDSQTLAFG